LAALAEKSAVRMQDTNDKMIARHAKEPKTLQDAFGAKKRTFSNRIML